MIPPNLVAKGWYIKIMKRNARQLLASKFAVPLCRVPAIYFCTFYPAFIIRSLGKFTIGSIGRSRPLNSSTKASGTAEAFCDNSQISVYSATLKERFATENSFCFKEQRIRKYPCRIVLERASQVYRCCRGRCCVK